MSALEDKILKICEQMFKVYEAGQLSGVDIQDIAEKVKKIPFVDEWKNELEGATRSGTRVNSAGVLDGSLTQYTLHQFNVTPGKKYSVTGTGYNYLDSTGNVYLPLVVFMSSGYRAISYEVGTDLADYVHISDYEVVAPEGAAYMLVNHRTPNDAVKVIEATEKVGISNEHLSDALQTMISAKGINTEYIWYANVDAVVKTSNPLVKLGGIADCKIQNCIYTVLSASGVLGNIVTMDLTAKTVDAIVSAGNFSKFHNGDLLLYAGGYEGVEAWRWIPQAEAKEDRDGWESAWDKQQVNKVPKMEALLEHMPKEITFHTEAGLLNWISKDGIHYVKAQTGNSANPVTETTKQSYMIYVGREFNGSDFTGKRFQLAHHLATNRYFYRIGTVASGGSFGDYAWKEITS